jgi:hypothetical protein
MMSGAIVAYGFMNLFRIAGVIPGKVSGQMESASGRQPGQSTQGLS